jgi:hypothetical protein
VIAARGVFSAKPDGTPFQRRQCSLFCESTSSPRSPFENQSRRIVHLIVDFDAD